jgi:hypothetical protein
MSSNDSINSTLWQNPWMNFVHVLPEINAAAMLLVSTSPADFSACLDIAKNMCPSFNYQIPNPTPSQGVFQVTYHPWLPMKPANVAIKACHHLEHGQYDACSTTGWTTQAYWWFSVASRHFIQLVNRVRTRLLNWKTLNGGQMIQLIVTPIITSYGSNNAWYRTNGQLVQTGGQLLVRIPNHARSCPVQQSSDAKSTKLVRFINRSCDNMPPLTSYEEDVTRELVSSMAAFSGLCLEQFTSLYCHYQAPTANGELVRGCVYWMMGDQQWLEQTPVVPITPVFDAVDSKRASSINCSPAPPSGSPMVPNPSTDDMPPLEYF